MSCAPNLNSQTLFYQQYQLGKRDELAGVLLALFLGGLGIHHFYLRRTALGILYVCFCWTGITTLLGLIECFFMPGRVREYNAILAATIAASLRIAVPEWPGTFSPDESPSTLLPCPGCGKSNPVAARFCSACGNPLM